MNSLRSHDKSICGHNSTYCIMQCQVLVFVFDRDSGEIEPEKQLRLHMYEEFQAFI